jgi:hypothetical protein
MTSKVETLDIEDLDQDIAQAGAGHSVVVEWILIIVGLNYR